jgi:hypothetical protein
MKIKEDTRNISIIDTEKAYIVQNLSREFAEVTGVLDDDKKNVKNSINNATCVLCYNSVFNLIIKDKNNPASYKSITKSFYGMKVILLREDFINKKKIAISKNDYSKNRLDWKEVLPIIEKIFKDTNVEILICP